MGGPGATPALGRAYALCVPASVLAYRRSWPCGSLPRRRPIRPGLSRVSAGRETRISRVRCVETCLIFASAHHCVRLSVRVAVQDGNNQPLHYPRAPSVCYRVRYRCIEHPEGVSLIRCEYADAG